LFRGFIPSELSIGTAVLFDALIPLPDGTSYNAYLIKAAKDIMIDSIDRKMPEILLINLDLLGIKRAGLYYRQSCRPDHSGAIPYVVAEIPGSAKSFARRL